MMRLYHRLVFHPGLLGFVAKLGLCRRHALLPKFQCILNSLEYTAAPLSARQNHPSRSSESAWVCRPRTAKSTSPIRIMGDHTTTISFSSTCIPRAEKNLPASIGETRIGRQDRKYRVVS